MFRIEYTKDDAKTTDPNEMCALCPFQYATKTTCCNKKLCGWHIRFDGEHADQPYYSCHVCETTSNIAENGFLRHQNTLYCEEHNIMTFCEKCGSYICAEHIIHECLEWVTVPEPVFTDAEREALIKKLYSQVDDTLS